MKLKEGIVLKTIKYQDSSKIVYILTEDGLISALLKNCLNQKSKNYSYSKELMMIGFDLTESKKNTFDIMTSGKVINSYINIQNTYEKLINAVEIISLCYEYSSFIEDNKLLFSLTKTILENLNNNTFIDQDNYLFYTYIFKFKLLYLLGVGLNINKCDECGNEEIVYFDFESGSCKCVKHAKNKFDRNLLEVIRILYLGKIELYNEEIFSSFKDFQLQIEKFINNYYDRFLQLNKKNLKIFEKLHSVKNE